MNAPGLIVHYRSTDILGWSWMHVPGSHFTDLPSWVAVGPPPSSSTWPHGTENTGWGQSLRYMIQWDWFRGHGAPANRYKTTVTRCGQAGRQYTLHSECAVYRDWNEQLTDSWNVRDIHFVSVFGALDQQVQQIRMQSDTIFRLQTRLQSLELEAMAWNGPNQWINTNTVPLKCTHQSLKNIYWTVLTWVICRLCSYYMLLQNYRTTYMFFLIKNQPSYPTILCPGRLPRRALNVAGRGWTRRTGHRGCRGHRGAARGLLGFNGPMDQWIDLREKSTGNPGFSGIFPWKNWGLNQ